MPRTPAYRLEERPRFAAGVSQIAEQVTALGSACGTQQHAEHRCVRTTHRSPRCRLRRSGGSPGRRPRAARCGSRRECRRGRPAPRRCGHRAPESRRGASSRPAPASSDRASSPAARRAAARARRRRRSTASSMRSPRRSERLFDQARTLPASSFARIVSDSVGNPACFSASRPLVAHATSWNTPTVNSPVCDVDHGRVMYHGAAVRGFQVRQVGRVRSGSSGASSRVCVGSDGSWVTAWTSRSSARDRPGRGRRISSRGAARASRSSTRRIRARSRAAAASPAARSRWWPTSIDAAALSGGPIIRSARFIDTPRGRAAVVSLDGRRRRRGRADRRRAAPPSTRPCSTPRERAGARARPLARHRRGRRRPRRRARHRRRHVDRASFVIGADGANSLVRRRVARAVPPRPAVDRDRLLRARRHQRRDRHRAVADPPGYIWSFPRPDSPGDRHLRAGRRGHPPATLRDRTARVDSRDAASPTTRGSNRTRGRFRRSMPRRSTRSTLAGRAGPSSATPPASSIRSRAKGIYFALAVGRSGRPTRVAAAHVRPRLRRARPRRDRRRARARRAVQGRILPAGVHRPADATRCSESAAIRAVMADLVAGRQPYRSLKWRLLGPSSGSWPSMPVARVAARSGPFGRDVQRLK